MNKFVLNFFTDSRVQKLARTPITHVSKIAKNKTVQSERVKDNLHIILKKDSTRNPA